MLKELKDKLFLVQSEESFNQLALDVFRYQAEENKVYAKYLDYLSININDIVNVNDIPFLPIQFFKTQRIISGPANIETTFTSSGTTGSTTSNHFVTNTSLYIESFQKAFEMFYGLSSDYCVLALLPSYLERDGSSLIYMVNSLIKDSSFEESGFFLYNHDQLHQTMLSLQKRSIKTILFGVSFALLDFIDSSNIDWPELIVMETGGMKGRKKELTRAELHHKLKDGFGVSNIHSEYGMTELLSQAYSDKDGIYKTPPWMKILIRDTTDPFNYIGNNKTGGLNVIDLANLNSCAFIATDDLGRTLKDGNFEVLGRFDHSDVRGCNLML